ncbi:MAG: hypothetical protein O7F73_05755, partial [Gammaproteobacteria bacterium]|nr:hypothetical protein [Gammaproteobacteria bacterium]
QLAPVQDKSAVTDGWRWAGKFSKAERSYLQQRAESGSRDGSLVAPWGETDSEAAARALSRDFACALRSQLQTRLALDWHEQSALPGVFSDTVNISRHLLGNYRELSVSATEAAVAPSAVAEAAFDEAAFAVDVRLVPLRENVWQLWLIGAPRRPGMAPVQAVTYFSVASVQWPRQVASSYPAAAHSKPQPLSQPWGRSRPDAEPLDYLDVKLLDATQTDGRGSRAALQVTLQLGNRAEWPMDYSFTLSGGHFNHCIATPGNYRHDHYGSLEGSLAAGESVVRRLVIENAEHRPTPIFGLRKCAGFRDLEGFEEFSRQGHRVTDYVRWQM